MRAYLTKSLPGVNYWNRIHLHASYQFNADRSTGERPGRYMLAAGYSFRLSSSAIGIADVTREQRMEAEKVENVGEVCVRYQVTPLLVVGPGAGLDSLRTRRVHAGRSPSSTALSDPQTKGRADQVAA